MGQGQCVQPAAGEPTTSVSWGRPDGLILNSPGWRLGQEQGQDPVSPCTARRGRLQAHHRPLAWVATGPCITGSWRVSRPQPRNLTPSGLCDPSPCP